jgi:hypothetical protein
MDPGAGPRLPNITFTAITMHGTCRLQSSTKSVTAQLFDAVAIRMYPTTTQVLRYIPDLPLVPYSEGMHFLQNRLEFLACLKALQQFL